MPDEGIWSAQDTTPAAIESALRELLKEQHAKSEAYVPARVLNMVAVVDREWRGGGYNRRARGGGAPPPPPPPRPGGEGGRAIDAWGHGFADRGPPPPQQSL